ncbi:MAG: type III-A CRISPR-associated RAMP protein Csm4 [Bernardetiaceae bacterium]
MPNRSFSLFRLNFDEPLHLSRGLPDHAVGQALLHSDTLKSALFVAALQLLGETGLQEKLPEGKLESFFAQFRLSSAFYYLQPGGSPKTLYFFPVPERKLNFSGVSDKDRKTLKKIAFLEKSVFEKVLQGEDHQVEFSQLSFSKGGKLVCMLSTADLSKNAVFKTDLYQHVHIPRDMAQDSVPYYVEKLYFEQDAGLFVLLDCSQQAFQDEVLLPAFRLLADSGIGTDRNTGQGHFALETDTLTLHTPEATAYDLSLSLYLPQKEELTEGMDASRYKLLRRGGWVSSPQSNEHLSLRKKSVFMFSEGSFFPHKPSRTGEVVDIKPEDTKLPHPIWRDGQALFVGMVAPDEKNTKA